MKSGILLLLLVLMTSAAFAESPAPSTGDAEIARKKARAYTEEKNWTAAETEAKKATELDPANADGWLVLGTIEQRLEHPAEALEAFRKYLSLNPPADKAAAVRSRVADLEVASEKKTKAEADEKTAKYGPRGRGFIFGFAPVYKPDSAKTEELNHGVSSALLVGYRMDESGDILFRYSSGTVPSLLVPSGTGTTTSTALSAKEISMEVDYNITLNRPFEKLGGFQFFIPLSFVAFSNWISETSGVLSNFGIAGGTGAGARFYSGSIVVIDAVFLYRIGFPIMDVSSGSSAAKNPTTGLDVKGNVSGPELRFAVTFLL